MFLRKTTIGREPLAVTMSGARLGERVLQIGVDDPRVAGAIAAKTGISGRAVILVSDEREAARAERGAGDASAAVDVRITPLGQLPFDEGEFDAVVVHNGNGLLDALARDARETLLREAYRVLRDGGRAVVIEPGTRSGLSALVRPARRSGAYEAEGGTSEALTTAAFRPVRILADRDGTRFVEGLKGGGPR